MIERFLDFIALEKGYSNHTQTAYKKNLLEFKLFLTQFTDTIDLDEVDHQDIRDWMVHLSEIKKNSSRTINRKVSVLKSYYKFLLQINHIEKSPVKKIKFINTSRKIPLPFTKDEMNQALEPTYFQNDSHGVLKRTIIALLYFTGIRRNELVSIQLENLHLDSKYVKVFGKRSKERFVPLIDQAVDMLQQYVDWRKEIDSLSSHLFIKENGQKISESFVYRAVTDYFSLVSTKQNRSPHLIRHSFASHLLDEGADLNAIKDLMGHQSVSSTEAYTHSSIASLKKVYRSAHPREKNNHYHEY